MRDIVVVLVEVLSLQEFKRGTGYIVARSHLKLAAIQEDTKLTFESTTDIADCLPFRI